MAVFLFTDIEKFTLLWENHREQMPQVIVRHNSILETQVGACGGKIVNNLGDGVFAVFENGQPLFCALEAQKQLAREDWGEVGQLLVRMALHAGEADQNNGDYFGPAVNRASRLTDIAWGGQILITPEVIDVCDFPEDARLHDLGVHLLKDLSRPQYVYEILHPDMPIQEFPPLRSLSARPSTLADALKTAQEFQLTSLAMYALVGLARMQEMEGKSEDAVELLTMVLANTPPAMVTARALALLAEIEMRMHPDTFAVAQQRGFYMNLEEVTQRLLSAQV